MRLVVACHWSDEDDMPAREAAGLALLPLKAPGTKGWVGTLEGDAAEVFYARMEDVGVGALFEGDE